MKNTLRQLHDLKKQYGCKIIYAGDIFHKWDSPAELINFALKYLPHGYAIPGQHDLPHHNYKDIGKSAYWTLVQAGKIYNLTPCEATPIGTSQKPVDLYGFPWGFDPRTSYYELSGKSLTIAAVHHYIWDTDEHSYPGAEKESNIKRIGRGVQPFNCAVFGDNHKGFRANYDTCNILNCGTLMRRNSDEINYKPSVGLIDTDGSITRHYLNITGEKMVKTAKDLELPGLNAEELVAMLSNLGAYDLDFHATVKKVLTTNKIKSSVRKLILQLLEKSNVDDS